MSSRPTTPRSVWLPALLTGALAGATGGCASSHATPHAHDDAAVHEEALERGWAVQSGTLLRTTSHPSLGGRTELIASERGLRVSAREFDVRIRLRGLGRLPDPLGNAPVATGFEEAEASPPQPASPERVVYPRGPHEEFFQLTRGGVEHGVLIRERPRGAGWLRAEVGFEGLRPALREGRVDLLNAAGDAVAHYTELHAFDADGRPLGTRLTVTPEGAVALDVEDAGARYPITIDPILWGTETITGSVAGCGAGGSGFGAALDVRGPQMAVGAPEACVAGASAGAVVVFDRPTVAWLESAVLSRPDAAAGDEFGARVALSDDSLVVSAPGARSGDGTVEVFVRLGRRFHAVATLEAPGDLSSTVAMRLGAALAADSDTIVAGAPGANDGAGAAVVYQRSATGQWTALQSLVLEGSVGLGGAVALSGSFIALRTSVSVELFERRSPTDPFVFAASLPLSGVHDLAAMGQGFVAATDGGAQRIDYDADATTPWTLGTLTAGPDAGTLRLVSTDAEGLAAAGSAGAAFYLALAGTLETDGTIPGSSATGLALRLDGQTLYLGDDADRVLVHRRVASNGEPCTQSSQCESGFCVDGVCCDTACGLGEVDCLACSVGAGSSADGVCETARAGATCRPSVGTCDAAEVCDGASPTCRADRLSPAGTTCRVSAGPCDVAEACAGASPFCPADGFEGVGVVCRAAAGDCDVAEACDGFRAECPADRVATQGRVCRASAGQCDVEEACDGETPACPRNGFKRFGTVCRPPLSNCDAPERCSGTSDECPMNEAQPDGTPCADGDACTEGDSCEAGLCVAGPNMCMAPTPTPPTPTSSGCSASRTPGTSPWPLLWLTLGLLAWRRRTRRHPRALSALTTGAALAVALCAAPVMAQDSDGDGVPDAMDVCPGGDDRVDFDVDGTPADCDCDDGRASTRPGAPELCNGQDNDCDGYADASFLSGGSATELQANRGTVAVGEVGVIEGTLLRWSQAYIVSGSVRYSEPVEHVGPGEEQALDLVIDPHTGSTDALYGFFDGARFVGVRVHFVAGERVQVGLALGSAQSTPTPVFGSTQAPYGRYRGSIPGYSYTLPFAAVHLTLRLHADGTQSLVLSGDDGNAVPLPIPAGSYLNRGSAWRLWITGTARNVTTYTAGVRVLERLADEDGDLVCDALDVCPSASDRRDADNDGVPDACDVCVGANGADNDGDGTPFPCDCDDEDAAIHPLAADVCDGRDNDCDELNDVGTLLDAVGNDLLYRVANGTATSVAVAGALPTFTSEDGGLAVRASLASGAGNWAVYYRETLRNNPTAGDPNRVRVVVDRDTRTGDHDFIVGLSDGQRVFGVELSDVGGSGTSYTAGPFVGRDDDTRIESPTFADVARPESRFPFTDASPYTLDFVFGADPRIEISTASGARGVVRMTAGEVGAIDVGALQLFLAANQPTETFVIRSLRVTQPHVDSDEDGVCEELDRCPGLDDTGPDQDSDGIPDACDICTGGPDDVDSDMDGVPDACDACPGFSDAQDRDDDGLPDGCDACPEDAANDFDRDGVCDMSDRCLLGPDDADADADGIPDACDVCPVDGLGDSDEDGTCDAGDVCLGDDRRGDRDGDGYCGDVDCDDTRASIHPGADEVCDGFDSNCDGVLPRRELDNNGNGRIDCRDGSGCSVDPAEHSQAPWWGALFVALLLGRRRRARP